MLFSPCAGPSRSPSVTQPARLLHEAALAAYCSSLAIWTNIIASSQHPASRSWVDALQSIIAKGSYAPDYPLANVILWLLLGIAFFLGLRALAGFSHSRIFLFLVGLITMSALPLAAGYLSFRGYVRMLGSPSAALFHAYDPHRWLAIEIVTIAAGVFAYVFVPWPHKTRWGISLLMLHFALWGWLALANWHFSLINAAFGFAAGTAWVFYVRGAEQHTPQPQASLPQ